MKPSNVTADNVHIKYVQIAVTGFITYISISANLLVILLLLSHKKSQHNAKHTAIVLICLGDLLRGGIGLSSKLYHDIHSVRHEGQIALEEPSCTVSAFTEEFFSIMAPFLLLFASVLQYDSINNSKMAVKKFSKMFVLYLVVMVFVAIVYSCFPLLGTGIYRYIASLDMCVADWRDYSLLKLLFCIILSLFILIAFIVCVVVVMARDQRSCINVTPCPGKNNKGFQGDGEETSNTIKQYSENLLEDYVIQKGVPQDNPVLFVNGYISIGCQNSRPENRSRKSDRLTLFVLISLCFAYLICTLPTTVVDIIQMSSRASLPREYLYIIETVNDTKAALNPIIIGICLQYHRRYWKTLKASFVKNVICCL